MGVEYRFLLIPRDNTHRPGLDAIQRLIAAWRDNGIAVRPGSPEHQAISANQMTATQAHAVETGASIRTASGWRSFHDADIGDTATGELILQWPVSRTEAGGVKNPFGLEDEDGTYFDLELHFADDFVQVANETIDPMDTACSKCGKDLEYWPEGEDIFYAGRIRQACPKCATAFHPQDRVAVYRDGETGEESDLEGGATYRFAIVIDCGKCWQTETSGGGAPTLSAEFLAVATSALGVPLYGVGHFY